MKILLNFSFLLLVSLYSLPGLSQQNYMNVGKLTRVGNKTYVLEAGKLFEIDEKVVLAKLRSGRILPEIVAKNYGHIAFDYYYITVPNGTDIERFISLLNETNDFEYVEFNSIYSPCMAVNDSYYSSQWFLSSINVNDAWDFTTGNPSVMVAVIDDGIELSHQDISYGIDSYSNISATDNVDYVSSTNHTPFSNHGTMIAGIIGAKTNNSIGVAGIVGGNNCSGTTIVSYRTNYTASQIISAIYDAVGKGVKVINLSIGGMYNSALANALDYAYNNSVTVVCSTGNDNSSSVLFPASHPNTIAVGAINQSNQRSSFSNYGNGIDLVAPGVSIKSTSLSNSYAFDSGTSFAAPQVAGVVALMLSINPSLSPSQIRSKLRRACSKLSTYSYSNGWNEEVGYGLLNAFNAVVESMNMKIVGPESFYTSGVYSIENLPSGMTVEWSLSNSFYDQNCLQQDYPLLNQCTITRYNSSDMINATLTATIKYNGVIVQTLTKTGLYAYGDFYGQYTSGNLSGTINYTHYFQVKPNATTYITSPNLKGGSASYNYSYTIPSIWAFSTQNGDITMVMPPNNNNIPIIINVLDVFGNNYQLYAVPVNTPYLSASTSDHSITISLTEEEHSMSEAFLELPWNMEIRHVATGRLMFSKSANSHVLEVSTEGWSKGIYVVKATVGKEVLTETIIVK